MTWVLLLYIFAEGELGDGKMIRMPSQEVCVEYKEKWEEKMKARPDLVLVAKCDVVSLPEQPKLKKERDS